MSPILDVSSTLHAAHSMTHKPPSCRPHATCQAPHKPQRSSFLQLREANLGAVEALKEELLQKGAHVELDRLRGHPVSKHTHWASTGRPNCCSAARVESALMVYVSLNSGDDRADEELLR